MLEVFCVGCGRQTGFGRKRTPGDAATGRLLLSAAGADPDVREIAAAIISSTVNLADNISMLGLLRNGESARSLTGLRGDASATGSPIWASSSHSSMASAAIVWDPKGVAACADEDGSSSAPTLAIGRAMEYGVSLDAFSITYLGCTSIIKEARGSS